MFLLFCCLSFFFLLFCFFRMKRFHHMVLKDILEGSLEPFLRVYLRVCRFPSHLEVIRDNFLHLPIKVLLNEGFLLHFGKDDLEENILFVLETQFCTDAIMCEEPVLKGAHLSLFQALSEAHSRLQRPCERRTDDLHS
mmetsp:Transcript_1066/g.1078  ORF Transcript_1066/g.1078 Transcript_1066/m.1078 type:complete len:138 (-) Transcript_1066:215-628(-)